MVVAEANFEESPFKTIHRNLLKIFSFPTYKFPTAHH